MHHARGASSSVELELRKPISFPAGTMPLLSEEPGSHTEAHLLVLPAEQPSNRRDALAVQAFLGQLIHNPSQASEM